MQKFRFVIITLSCFCFVSRAYAAEIFPSGTIYTFATDSKSEANMIQLPFNIDPNCNIGTASRAYIRKEQKQLFATALSAAAQGKTVNLGIETNAAPLVIHSGLPNPLRCEVFQIIIFP